MEQLQEKKARELIDRYRNFMPRPVVMSAAVL
jgi:hypothetical protein